MATVRHGLPVSQAKWVSDVGFGLHVQAALNMAMLSLFKDKVVTFDFDRRAMVV